MAITAGCDSFFRFVKLTKPPTADSPTAGGSYYGAEVSAPVFKSVAQQVLEYLGRYTHRVALSNDRLVDHRDDCVRFRWKDYADHDRGKVLTLAGDEFLRRFLLHVVPRLPVAKPDRGTPRPQAHESVAFWLQSS